jgi:diguanylate cyclase (GGDEF)-like protein
MPTEKVSRHSLAAWVRQSTVLQIASVAFGCMVCAQFAATYTLASSAAVVLWLPNAVVLSALLLSPAKHWWRFGLTQVLSELAIGAGARPLVQALGYALANVGEVWLAALLIRRWCGPAFAFSNGREVLLFAAIAMGLAPGLMALLGTWLHYNAGLEKVSFFRHWQVWWIGDGMGMVVLTPLLFGWLRLPPKALPHQPPNQPLNQPLLQPQVQALAPSISWLERAGFVLLAALLLWLLFYTTPQRSDAWVASPLLLLPLFWWAALRFGTRGVSLLGCLVSLLAIVLTAHGRGMFALLEPGLQTQLLQQYLAALLLTGLAVAAMVNDLALKYQSLRWFEQDLLHAHGALTRLNQELEARVAQRTAELERLATTDALTDAHNRRFLMHRAEIEIALARRQQHAVSMVMFDIDHFKQVNDSHGHQVGDRVLVALSQAVTQELRLGDTFARVGGEEFVLLLPRSDAEQAWQVAKRLRAMLEALDIPAAQGLVLHITASFGVATLQPHTSGVDALYEAADSALYQAKAAGRNCVVAHTSPTATAAALFVVQPGR